MSSPKQFLDGQNKTKVPEKSNFVETCNLLSKYIKEKGSLRDLNIEIGGKIECLEDLVKPVTASASTTKDIMRNKRKSTQPFSKEQQPNMPSINTIDASYKPTSKDGTTTTDPNKTSQLTIFYSGKVLVFDDYPADKVNDLVAFAKKGSSQMSYGILSNTLGDKTNPAASTASPREGLPPRPQVSGSHIVNSSNPCKEKTNVAAGGDEQRVLSQPEANIGSDLPIARRSSIHRFLAKRKDRSAARGPYQVQEQPTSSSNGDEQLELKL